jgi:hypothetical protein
MRTRILVTAALLMASCVNSEGQTGDKSSNTAQPEILLNRANDGQHIAAYVGQPIIITLQTIGGGNYGTPQISSRAIRFVNATYAPAREQNPGGPKQRYRFVATAEGDAQILIPHTGSNPTVTFTFQVKER